MPIFHDPVDFQLDFRDRLGNHKETFVVQTEFADTDQIFLVHNVAIAPDIDS